MLAKLGASQHGLFLTPQAVDLGVSKAALLHRSRLGWIVPVVRGLYRLRDHPWTSQTATMAAVLLAGPRAVASHGTAARAHGFWAYAAHGDQDVTVKEGSNHRLRIGRLHISSWLPDDHVVHLDGIPTTSVARTVFDLAGDVPPRLRNEVGRQVHANHMRRVLNDALRRRGLTLLHEAAVLAALAKRGRSGTVLTRSLVEELSADYDATDSDGEDLFLRMVDGFGLPKPSMHVVLSDARGFIGEVDFVFAGWLIVEVDGRTHDGPLDRRADRERDARLEALGFVVRRVRYESLLVHPDRIARELFAMLKEGAK